MTKHTGAILFLFMAILLALTGCGKSPVATFEESFDADSSSLQLQNNYGVCFFETKQAKYILENKKIYFAPQGSDEFSLLCTRPDCSHTDENCNAYGGVAIGWFDDKLYSATLDAGGPKLISMKPDGSEHRVVGELLSPLYPNGQSGGSYWFYFCDSCLYYMIWPPSDEYLPTMARTDLLTGKTDEPWKDTIPPGLNGGHISQFSNGKWYMEADMAEDEGISAWILEADPETGAFTPILDNPGGTRAMWWRVEDTTILYFEPGRGICSYDWNRDEDRCLLKLPGSEEAWCEFGLEYIYLSRPGADGSSRRVDLYNWECQLVDSVEVPRSWSYVTETSDRVYFGTNNWGWHMQAYLDKSEVGAGNLSLHDVVYP